MSDFAAAAAHVRRGFFPLCGVLMRIRELAPEGSNAFAARAANVGWQLTSMERSQ